jgi:hypothetical protein
MDVLDIYTVDDITYIDLNPGLWITIPNHEITSKFTTNVPINLEVYRTVTYNVAIYVKCSKLDQINFNGKVYFPKVVESKPVLSQLCLVFKNEIHRIPKLIEFYKRVHNVDRFLLYDNNSDEQPSTEILNDPTIIYIKWPIPYKHRLTNKNDLAIDYNGPDDIIIAQNSAYSNALKKYHTATWTILLDTDEFLVRRSGNASLKSILESIKPSTDTLILRGFWAGCNKFQKSTIFENLHRISKRGNKFCMNKLILRTSQHKFTDCIHRAYPTEGNTIVLGFDKGIYFFHLYILSEKRKDCDCRQFCNHSDRSFIESWFY